MIDLTLILDALLRLLAAIIIVKVIPWIKARTTNEQQATIRATVRTLVFAAEQMYGAGKGEEKLAYVVDQLMLKGITVNRAEIEAAIKENINRYTVTSAKE